MLSVGTKCTVNGSLPWLNSDQPVITTGSLLLCHGPILKGFLIRLHCCVGTLTVMSDRLPPSISWCQIERDGTNLNVNHS